MPIGVIGAGAAGLAFSVRLNQKCPNAEITVFEAQPSAGQKILATGNGRCNLSNTDAGIIGYNNPFAKNIVDVNEALDFFSSIGLKTREESQGRLYPYSLQAQSVRDVLLTAAKSLGVQIITECTVKGCAYRDKRFMLKTSKGDFACDILVIASGGKAGAPQDTASNGYSILQSFSHTLIEPCPALVQLTSPNKICRILKGMRTKCNLTIGKENEILYSEQGELLFTEYGLSGIVSLDAGTIVAREFANDKASRIHAIIDFAPDFDTEQIAVHYKKFGNLTGIVGNAVSDIIQKQCNGDCNIAAKCCKNQKLIISGTKGFSFAQVTSGGICVNEFTEHLESKKQKNLFAVGEVLDVDGKCGGFNLQWAWSSAIKAADYIGSYL